MQDQYLARTFLHLPLLNDGEGRRKKPGDTVTREELEEAKQGEEQVQELLDNGALSADLEAIVHEAHFPVTADRYGEPVVTHPGTGEAVEPLSTTGDSIKPEDKTRPWAKKKEDSGG